MKRRRRGASRPATDTRHHFSCRLINISPKSSFLDFDALNVFKIIFKCQNWTRWPRFRGGTQEYRGFWVHISHKNEIYQKITHSSIFFIATAAVCFPYLEEPKSALFRCEMEILPAYILSVTIYVSSEESNQILSDARTRCLQKAWPVNCTAMRN